MTYKLLLLSAIAFITPELALANNFYDPSSISDFDDIETEIPKEDYLKQAIEKYGDLYFDVEECPEYTTNDMVEWYQNKEILNKQNIKELTNKLASAKINSNLKGCMNREATAWNKLSKTINEFDANYLYLAWSLGGTMGDIYKANAPEDIAFIRMSCLKDDYATLCQGEQEDITTKLYTATKRIGDEAIKITKPLAYTLQDTFSQESINGYMGRKVYDKVYQEALDNIETMLRLLDVWISKREAVKTKLPTNVQAAYDHHTHKVINSLVLHIIDLQCD